MLTVTIVNMVELAVQQVGFTDGTNFDLSLNPVGASAGHFFLLQAVGLSGGPLLNLESVFVGFFRVKRLNEARLAKKKSQRLDAVKLFA